MKTLFRLTLVLFFFVPSSAHALDFDFLTSASDTTDTSTYTFSDINLGTAHPDRYIIVGIHSRTIGEMTISSVTINGVSANVDYQTNTGAGASNQTGFAIAKVPGGTSGDIVVNFDNTSLLAGISVYRVVGINGKIPFDTAFDIDADPQVTLDIPAGGFAIGLGTTANTGPASWTGLTEDHEGMIEAVVNFSGASTTTDPLQDDLTVQVNYTFEAGSMLYAASWQPEQLDASPESMVDPNSYPSTWLHMHGNPMMVWENNKEGFLLYAEFQGAGDTYEIGTTSDGGIEWSDNNNSALAFYPDDGDTIFASVWYDRWTPDDDSGNKVHIMHMDSSEDDTFYTEYDLSTHSTSTTVKTGTESATSFNNQLNSGSIAKARDGTLYVTSVETGDGWVHVCSSTCTSGGNWSAITDPYSTGGYSLGDDHPTLVPIPGTDNMMLINWDTGSNDIDYRIYSATSSSWWDWVEIDPDVPDLGGRRNALSATINKETGMIYMAFVNDHDDQSTPDHDIEFWEFDPSTLTWTKRTDVVTNASGALYYIQLALDENTGDMYVIYAEARIINDNDTQNIYYKKTVDNGQTWSATSTKVSELESQIHGLASNVMSDSKIGVSWVTYTSGIPSQYTHFYSTIWENPPATSSPISVFSAEKDTGTSVQHDFGEAGNNRLVAVFLADASEPGESFQGTVTADGKTFTQLEVAENTNSAGMHMELHVIDEASLGSTNGTNTISFSGGDGGWAIRAVTLYGVKSATPYDIGESDTEGSADTLTVSNIDSTSNSIILAAGTSNSDNPRTSGWSSPLIEIDDSSSDDPTASAFGWAYGLDVAGFVNKSYNVTFDPDNDSAAMIVAVFEAFTRSIRLKGGDFRYRGVRLR